MVDLTAPLLQPLVSGLLAVVGGVPSSGARISRIASAEPPLLPHAASAIAQ